MFDKGDLIMFSVVEIIVFIILLIGFGKLIGIVGFAFVAFLAGGWMVYKKKKAGEEPRRNQGIRFLFGGNDCFDPEPEPKQAETDVEQVVEAEAATTTDDSADDTPNN